MNDICIVYITTSDKEEAIKIGEAVVKKRLAACANIIENMTSIYWWEETVHTGREAVLLLKTKASLFAELEKAVKEIHSYTCPCVVAIPLANASEPYADWVRNETK